MALAQPAPQELDSTSMDILHECSTSTKATAQILFPEGFERPFVDMHEQIFELIDDPNIRQVAIAAPRGFGKTTIVGLALPARHILFQSKNHIVFVANNADNAQMQTESLKAELMNPDNDLLISLFGEQKCPGMNSKELWATRGGVYVRPKGADQQVRGLKQRHHRPDLIIVDDFEKPDGVLSDTQRPKSKKRFFSDLMGCVDRGKKNYKVLVIGSVLHEDALLVDLLDDPDWESCKFDLCDDQFNSNWPDFMSTEDIKKLAESFRRQGILELFYMDYRNMVTAGDQAKFKQEWFRGYDESTERLWDNPDIENVILVDPAKTLNITSAESAVVGVGVDARTNKIYVRDVVSDKFTPDQLYKETFDMAARLGAKYIGVEVTSLNNFITYPMQTEIDRQGLRCMLVHLNAHGDKDARIMALRSFYRQKLIYHNNTIRGKIEAQLLPFPRAKLKDVIDAFSYIVRMLDEGDVYFMPPDDYDEKGEMRKEFDQLRKEDSGMARSGDWRRC